MNNKFLNKKFRIIKYYIPLLNDYYFRIEERFFIFWKKIITYRSKERALAFIENLGDVVFTGNCVRVVKYSNFPYFNYHVFSVQYCKKSLFGKLIWEEVESCFYYNTAINFIKFHENNSFDSEEVVWESK